MTQEEIAKVKAMSREERKAHFTPLFRLGKITYAQYSYIVDLQESTLSDSQPYSLADDKDALDALAREFGGYVIPDTPKKYGDSWADIQKAKLNK